MNVPTYLVAHNVYGPCFTSPFLSSYKIGGHIRAAANDGKLEFLSYPVLIELIEHVIQFNPMTLSVLDFRLF